VIFGVLKFPKVRYVQ